MASIELRRLGAAVKSSDWESVVLVAGMRRAGNHAIVGWLASAYESAPAPLEYSGSLLIGVSESGITAHLNDIPLSERRNQRRRWNTLRSQRELLMDLDGPRRLILSVEEVTRRQLDREPLFAGGIDARIHVSRSVLNLLASRLALIEQEPMYAKRELVTVDQAFLDRIADDLAAAPSGWVEIDFDRWSTGESSYRAALLEQLHLSVDIAPPMSLHGGGSSFTGRDELPESTDLHSRWMRVEWPDDLLDLLNLERNRRILTEFELDHLSDLRS
jgi:hypothetical protein